MVAKIVRGTVTLLMACLVIGASSTCEAQRSSPVMKTYAYEREVVGGIPGGGGPPGASPEARRTNYVIYIETPPHTNAVVEGVWMNGQFHHVDTVVKPAPVRFESPVALAQEDVAVPATSNTVTEITVKDLVPDKTPDADVSKILGDHAAALQIRDAGKSVLVPIKSFARRAPLYRP
jgi:hypothetical protein